MQKVFSIFAQNLAYYNEGSIEGGWLDLPQSPDVIDRYLKEVVKVDDEHEEYEIADIDDNTSPFPYASIQWSSGKELNELATTLNYAKGELAKTEELRKDLMANVSHDLKTPLTMIKAYAEMSTELHQNNKKKQKEDMDIIISEVDRLTILVNDILELSSMQSNINNLEKTDFDLINLVKEIIHRYKVLQETENYKFIFNHKAKEIIINADKKKIEQVIYNLINNAINYTGEDNKVTINIIEEKDNILVEIKDTGKGIKKEDLPYIWDKYYKNKKKHKRNLIGTGLGLSIVKNALELHSFNYGVTSTPNKGSTFYFRIPNIKNDKE